MLWQGRALGLKLEKRGSVDQPRLLLRVFADEALEAGFLESLAEEIGYRCNLQMDLVGFYDRFADDPRLGPVILRWYGMRLAHFGSLYEYLVIAIVLQNATVRRSVSMLQALLERYGRLLAYDGRELYCFWVPGRLVQASEAELRLLKVGYRAKSIQRVTQAFTTGAIDEFELRHLSCEQQRQALLKLYGIGPASVGYNLFDVFHQLDELNHISPWEQKIYSKLFFDRDPEDPASAADLLDYFEAQYGGYRMLAVHYFWEDLFWRRVYEPLDWLEKLIRL